MESTFGKLCLLFSSDDIKYIIMYTEYTETMPEHDLSFHAIQTKKEAPRLREPLHYCAAFRLFHDNLLLAYDVYTLALASAFLAFALTSLPSAVYTLTVSSSVSVMTFWTATARPPIL